MDASYGAFTCLESMKQGLLSVRVKNLLLFCSILLVLLLVVLALCTLLHRSSINLHATGLNSTAHKNYRLCFTKLETESIETLYTRVISWKNSTEADCRDAYRLFSEIFIISQETGQINIPSEFHAKLKNMYHFSEDLLQEMKEQRITKVFNKVTHESNMFNPIRGKRVTASNVEEDLKYVKQVSEESGRECDFCNYTKYTATDIFGHMESEHCVTAANAFKYERWHTLVLFRSHHPLHWDLDTVLDAFHVADKWFALVYNNDPGYSYPTVTWEMLPHSSASQIHPHIHLSVSRDRYFGGLEHWRLSAEDYTRLHPGREYFSDLIAVHDILGLVTYHGNAVAIASLTPKVDNEFVVITTQPDESFYTLLYYVIRTYIEKMELFCFSMTISLPPMDASTSSDGRPLPTFARIVTRGSASAIRSDAGSLELFTGSNVNKDPYQATATLRQFINEI